MPQSLPALLLILYTDEMSVGSTVDAKLPESLVLRDQDTCWQVAEWASARHQWPVKPHIEDWSVDATDSHDRLPKRCEVSA